MTSDQIKEVLDRVLTWSPERQQDAVHMLLLMEAQEGEVYHPSDDEWAAIIEGVEQVDRGETISVEEMSSLWKRHDL